MFLFLSWIWAFLFCLLPFLIELQDAAKKLKDSLKGKTSPNMEENDSETRLSEDAETSLSEPSSDDGHSESSEDVSPITDDYNRMFCFRCLFQMHDDKLI